MVAFAASYDGDGNKQTKVHVFYNQQNKNLGLLFRDEAGEQNAPFNNFASGDDARDGAILNPSFLAVTKFNNQDFVFGVTEKKGFTASSATTSSSDRVDPNGCQCPPGAREVDLALVSPVYKVVSKYVYSDNYKIAACCSPRENWIYYLKKKGNKLNLYEATIGKGADNEYPKLTDPIQNSPLAAWYGTVDKLKHIVYQSDDNNLYEFTTNPTSNTKIDAAKGVKPGTSIAVAVTDEGIYLYYIDSSNMISRVSKSLTKGALFKNNETVEVCTNEAADDTQLTVTTADKTVHIFYAARDQGQENVCEQFLDVPPKPSQ